MFQGNTMFASEGVFVFIAFLPIFCNLILIGFGIYFVIKVIKFMNEKIKSDRERNEKIVELIMVISEGEIID